MNLVLALVLSQFATDVFENETAFEKLDTRAGVTLSKRPVKGSVFFEYRAVAETTLTVEQLCVALFEWGTKGGDGVGVILNKVLTDGDDVRVVYTQISQPIVANRDYALTVKRERPTPTTCRTRFRTTNDAAPKKPEGFVRMEKLWGEWLMEPTEKGTRVTYTLFSDPAGSVPAFLVHGPAQNATRDSIVLGLEKAKKYVEAHK
jgi:hypothetical protein